MECAPGVDDVAGVVKDHTAEQVEKLARMSLKRG
jgi:hypothetical protein